jgi:hypothetical protein
MKYLYRNNSLSTDSRKICRSCLGYSCIYQNSNFDASCHVLVTRRKAWIGNYIYYALVTRKYEHSSTH